MLLAALVAALPMSQAEAARKRRPPPPPPPRVEIPIERVVMHSGSERFWVPIRVGGVGPIRALLDTGSTGLLVLNKALGAKGFAKVGTFVYGFENNELLSGTINQARISIGDLRSDGAIRFGIVRKTKCAPKKPKCLSDGLKPSDYGIGGDGTPGEGFDAILGTGLDRVLIANPLLAAGGAIWIVALPQPGSTAPGKLIINPDAADLAGFRRYPLPREALRLLGAFRAALPGCLTSADASLNLCGHIGLDTGSPKVIAKVASLPSIAKATTPQKFKLQLSEGEGQVEIAVDEDWKSGRQVYFDEAKKQKTPVINAGVFPYYSYLVLYDFRKNELGLKKR
jgi:hypothetical protein